MVENPPALIGWEANRAWLMMVENLALRWSRARHGQRVRLPRFKGIIPYLHMA